MTARSDEIIDLTIEQYEGNLTHPIHGRTPVHLPGTGSHATTRRWGLVDPYDGSTVSLANEYILISGHTGTHVDAPFHVDAQSMLTTAQIPLARTQGPAVWLDLSAACEPGRVYSVADLEAAEVASGETIRAGDIVLLHTGWLDRQRGDVQTYVRDAPSLEGETASWFRERGIKALGVDLATPDAHRSADLPIHLAFLRPRSLGLADDEYILIYENLRNIDHIPAKRFHFSGHPIPFRGASGSPVRAVATPLNGSVDWEPA